MNKSVAFLIFNFFFWLPALPLARDSAIDYTNNGVTSVAVAVINSCRIASTSAE